MQTPKSEKKEQERVLQVHGKDRGDTGCPLQPMEDHSGADIRSAACDGPQNRADGYVLKAAAAHGKSMQDS